MTFFAQMVAASGRQRPMIPSVGTIVSQSGANTALVHAISAPAQGDHLIAVGFSTDAELFSTPTDNSAGSSVWNSVYSKTIGNWDGGFNLGIEVYVKESDGDETSVSLAPGPGHIDQDAIASFVFPVSGLAAGNPFDVLGEADVADSVGLSLNLTLNAATTSDNALVTAFAAFRDDSIGSFSFDNLANTNDASVERNGGAGAFDLTGLMAADVLGNAAAHSSNLTISGAGPEELMGVILAWIPKIN